MEFEVFKNKLINKMNKININLDEEQVKMFYNYMNILLEWNKFMNLTAITEYNEIILKHFVDCGIVVKFIDNEDKILDLGTGAGFPRNSN